MSMIPGLLVNKGRLRSARADGECGQNVGTPECTERL